MKKVLILAALAAAALAVSCQTKEAPELNVEDSNLFTCVIAQPQLDTRFNITPAGKTSWEPGDKIMIHGGANGAERLEIELTAADISSDGKKATFSIGDMEPYDRTDANVVSMYYAQYPADLVPEGNMYYECCFQGTDAPLMAACNVGNVFTFYNLCGIIAFTVNGSFDKVVFAGNNKETVAFDIYQVRVRDDGDGPAVNYHKPGNNWKTYTELKTVEKEVVADGSTVNYIYLPKGVNFSGGFNFQFYSGSDLVMTAKTETAVNVDHGKILNLGNISSHLETYVAPSYSDHTSTITGATDLSAGNGPANCYIISAPGAYKLPVVCGNDPEEVPGSVFEVELLWETYNNTEEVTPNSVIASVDFDGPSNYVFFQTPATLQPGNALIAAKDNLGKIIWSWHIWIPETDFTVGDFGGIITTGDIMSRNLGALVDATEANCDPRSGGLFYQWGRKDPFIGAGALGKDTGAFATIAGTAKSVTTEQYTVAQSVANPTVFVAFKGDWTESHNNELWGDSGAKTIYDPCPAGYRVTKRNSSDLIWSTDADILNNGETPFVLNPDGYTWKIGTAVFPFCGYLYYSSGSLTHPYDRSVIWNSHRNNDEVGYVQYVFFENTWQAQPGWGQRKSTGSSVRCAVDAPAE